MAPESSDPFMFASIRLLLHKEQHQHCTGKSARLRSSSYYKLFSTSSSASGGSQGSNRRHHKRKGLRRSNSKLPLHYLKPGALAQLRDAQRSSRVSCIAASVQKKRADSSFDRMNYERDSEAVHRSEAMGPHQSPVPAIVSMTPGLSLRMHGPFCPQRKKLLAPRTPFTPVMTATNVMAPITPVNLSSPLAIDFGGESLLESLPLELLVQIVCNLHHHQLKPAFHVSKRLRQAVLIARQCHFDFTTPDRERQDALQTTTPRADLKWKFNRRANAVGAGPSMPRTPMAPRPVLNKPMQGRISFAEMQQLAGPLFHGSANRVQGGKLHGLQRPSFPAAASHRVLFYEEELCQAVAQNSL